MNKLLSCRYSMDINRVEARFEGGTALAIGCAAIENEYGNTPGAAGKTGLVAVQQATGVRAACAGWRDQALSVTGL